MFNKKAVLVIVGVSLVTLKILSFKVGPCSPELEETLRNDH